MSQILRQFRTTEQSARPTRIRRTSQSINESCLLYHLRRRLISQWGRRADVPSLQLTNDERVCATCGA